MVDLKGRAERIEVVIARRRPPAQTEEAISELLAVVGQNGADADRTGALQIPQEAARIGRCLGREDADENPACGAINAC